MFVERYQIRDVYLLDDIFEEILPPGENEHMFLVTFFEKLVMHMSGDFNLKISVIFDVYCILDKKEHTPHHRVLNLLADQFDLVYDAY